MEISSEHLHSQTVRARGVTGHMFFLVLFCLQSGETSRPVEGLLSMGLPRIVYFIVKNLAVLLYIWLCRNLRALGKTMD